MRTSLVFGAILALTLPGPASAQLNNFIEVCGSENAAPADVVRMCGRALDSGKLGTRATAQVQANLGVGLYEMERYGEAVAAYTAALEIEPQMIVALLNRARAHERLRMLNEAANDYGAVLKIDPQAADAFVGRGALLLQHGDPERAILDFDSAITIKPSWISPYFNRGVALMRLSRFAEAEKDFSHVISRNPGDAGAFLNRARARAALGDSNAGADFDQALQIEPEWGGGWFARGKFYDEKGNREAANRDFQRAYELGYPDPWLILRMREISG